MSDELTLSDVMNDFANHNADPFDDVVEEGDFEDMENDSVESDTQLSEEENSQAIEDVSEHNSEEVTEKNNEEDVVEAKEEADNKEEEVEEIDPSEKLQSFQEKLDSGELEIQINEEETVTLKDLKNDYMGQKEIARRFSEYDVKSKQLEKDVQEVEGYINEFASKLKDGDSVGAMAFFGEFAGVPPYMIKEQLIAALAPEIQRRAQMTSTEVQNEYLQQQNDYLNEQRESEQERVRNEQANMELNSNINKIRETHNIDEDTWNQTYEGLSKTLAEGEEITPELVAETINYGRMYKQAETLVTSFEGQLENQEKWVEQLVEIKEKYPDFTEEDLKEVLESAYSTHKKSLAEQKLAQKVEAKKKIQPKKQTKQQNQTQPEDIDPELEDWL